MTFMADEVATQPGDWIRAQHQLPTVAASLPSSGERVAVVGCGTSLFIAQSYAALREDSGDGVTDAWPASEHRLRRGYDRVVYITRSGTTTEVIDAMKGWPDNVPAGVITADPHSPAAGLAEAIVLDDVDEKSVVQTRFATTTLALLRASLGHDLEPAASQAERILAADDGSFAPLTHAEQITFVGIGAAVGIAHEAALKLRETTQLWAESYPAMEYRHGPISIAAPGRVTWAFGEVPAGLADEVSALGAMFVHHDVDPLAELVRVHRLCLIRATAAGLNVDLPRGLNRSVILNG